MQFQKPNFQQKLKKDHSHLKQAQGSEYLPLFASMYVIMNNYFTI